MDKTRRGCLFAILGLALFCPLYVSLTMLLMPAELRVQYVPDDAFYYLGLSRNFFRLHFWTFDSGISRTSGFHPLHAYVLVSLFWIVRPSAEQFVQAAMILSSMISLGR